VDHLRHRRKPGGAQWSPARSELMGPALLAVVVLGMLLAFSAIVLRWGFPPVAVVSMVAATVGLTVRLVRRVPGGSGRPAPRPPVHVDGALPVADAGGVPRTRKAKPGASRCNERPPSGNR
jgi:hypothetical protein